MNRWFEKIVRRIPNAVYRLFIQRRVVPYFYHLISDRPSPHHSPKFPHKTPEMFEHDLQYLRQNCTTVSYPQLVDLLAGRARPGKNPVFISFDDGFKECFTIVRPLLLKYELPCTFFITTDVIDNRALLFRHKQALCLDKVTKIGEHERQTFFQDLERCLGRKFTAVDEGFASWLNGLKARDIAAIDCLCALLEIDEQTYLNEHTPYLTRDQLRALVADGFTIGAHSCSHALLCDLDLDEIRHEIKDSCHIIQSITGDERIPFAFPFYGAGIPLEWLDQIRSEDSSVGLFFDTNGLHRGSGLVLDRIWADAPEWDGSGRSTLPQLLHLTYEDMLLERLHLQRQYS